MNNYSFMLFFEEVIHMPAFDGTGPQGYGSMTGRGFGPCSRGYGYWYPRQRFYSKKNDLSSLENEEKILEEELKAIKAQKEEIKKAVSR